MTADGRPDGFVLAGGASVRMGSDKARVRGPDGLPLAVHVARALAAVCGRVRVVRHGPEPSPDPDWPELAVVVDTPGDRHPLRGVAAALAAATTPTVIVAPCDLGALTTEAVHALWRGAAGGEAVAGDGSRLHPLFAVLDRARASAAARAADEGTSVRGWVAGLPVVVLPASVLCNVNHPSDVFDLRAGPDGIG